VVDYEGGVHLIDIAPACEFGRSEELVGRAIADRGSLAEVCGESLGTAARAKIERILQESVTDPVGPEFMAPQTLPKATVLRVANNLGVRALARSFVSADRFVNGAGLAA
jgi:hypothetical protein